MKILKNVQKWNTFRVLLSGSRIKKKNSSCEYKLESKIIQSRHFSQLYVSLTTRKPYGGYHCITSIGTSRPSTDFGFLKIRNELSKCLSGIGKQWFPIWERLSHAKFLGFVVITAACDITNPLFVVRPLRRYLDSIYPSTEVLSVLSIFSLVLQLCLLVSSPCYYKSKVQRSLEWNNVGNLTCSESKRVVTKFDTKCSMERGKINLIPFYSVLLSGSVVLHFVRSLVQLPLSLSSSRVPSNNFSFLFITVWKFIPQEQSQEICFFSFFSALSSKCTNVVSTFLNIPTQFNFPFTC